MWLEENHNRRGIIAASTTFIVVFFCLIPVFCLEDNTDRPGGDYRHFDLSTANPTLCEQACTADSNCQAFTYVRPGIQGPNPQCWLKNTVPVSTSNSCCVSGVKAISPGGSSGTMEDNTDRPGGDYRHFDLSTADPSLCQQACAGDSNCQAFTYVRPGVQGPNPQCWLKNTVPVSTSDSCCVSGVKTGSSGGSSSGGSTSGTSSAMEDNTDRPGGDYRHFDLSTANPSLCEQACAADSNCQAFTYVRPGVQGPNPQCWLKNTVPVSTSDSCCISGVKAVASGTTGTLEDNTDRPGGDYRHFDLSTANPSLCEQACAGDSNCQAFTYVRPGVQGPNPQCWLKNTVPVSTSDSCCVSGVKTVSSGGSSSGGSSSGGSSSGASSTMEDNTDRPGGDYRHFDLSTANPSLCEQACAGDSNCQAFTYVRPGVQGPNPQCWLKNTVPVSTSNSCCISGVKAVSTGGTAGTMEDNTDRPGGDYRHFDLSTANPSLCQQACAGDSNCQAFTYVRPGVQGPNPQCWLKNTVPVSTSNSCCISGVKT